MRKEREKNGSQELVTTESDNPLGHIGYSERIGFAYRRGYIKYLDDIIALLSDDIRYGQQPNADKLALLIYNAQNAIDKIGDEKRIIVNGNVDVLNA